jgi:hypothetical protein
VRESQIILDWKREAWQEAEVETARRFLLDLIQLRLENPVSDPVRRAIEGTNDLDILRRWFHNAATANSLAEFRAAMPPQP